MKSQDFGSLMNTPNHWFETDDSQKVHKKRFLEASQVQVQVQEVVVLKAWRASNVVSFVSGFLCFLDGYAEGNVVWLCATFDLRRCSNDSNSETQRRQVSSEAYLMWKDGKMRTET